MTDLLQSARFFEVSARLANAAHAIGLLAEDKRLAEDEQESLKWAGDFLTRVDWTTDRFQQTGVGGNFVMSVTTARPIFFASIRRIAPHFQKVGIDDDKKLTQFLNEAYTLLSSKGEKPILEKRFLNVLEKLLQIISESIMVRLSNNGLPKKDPFSTVCAPC